MGKGDAAKNWGRKQKKFDIRVGGRGKISLETTGDRDFAAYKAQNLKKKKKAKKSFKNLGGGIKEKRSPKKQGRDEKPESFEQKSEKKNQRALKRGKGKVLKKQVSL